MYELRWLEMLPSGNGWNVQTRREGRAEPFRKYYGVSLSTVMRLMHILNRDDYHNFHMSAGRAGWMEIQLYPDEVLKYPA